jgi:16S rRNA (uracil1498-N3)-methyltransferase
LSEFAGADIYSMSERFFVATPITGARATLTDDEARHLASVMRAKIGDRLTLFDGSGAEFVATIERIDKRSVELAVAERREVSCELPCSLTLAVALPKGDRHKWLVEKATELGVSRLVPLVTERGVAQPVEAVLERLARGVIEASKQCGRNRLMEIGQPQTIAQLFDSTPGEATRLFADPAGVALADHGPLSHNVLVAIGPEGGFAPGEQAAALAAGWQAISLGSRILRVETAALAAAAWIGIQATAMRQVD